MIRNLKYYTKQFWQLVIIASTTFIAILYPLELTFQFKSNLTFWISNYLITAIFTLDIIFNLYYYSRNPYKNSKSDKITSLNYIRAWFIVDLLAVYPVSILFNLSAVWGLLRLIKIIKVEYFISEFRKRTIILTNMLLFVSFMYWLLLIAHWISCGWLKIGTQDFEISILSNYINAFYWSITTLTTVGYGDIIPITNAEKIYTMFVQIIGVAFYGFLIGNVASIFTKKDSAKAKYLANIEKLSMLVKYRKLPRILQTRLQNYYYYEWKYKSGYSDDVLLGDLPVTLKNDTSLFLKKRVLEKISLFSEVSDEFIKRITTVLTQVTLTPNDILIKEGEESTGMYFIIHGKFSVYYDNGKTKVAQLKDGDYLGEYSLVKNVPRIATVISDTFSDLYFLEKSDFDNIAKDFETIKQRIENKVIELDESFVKK